MSRDTEQQNTPGLAGQKPHDVDLDAEHDPDVARRASNAALRRVAVQMKAGTEGKEPAHQAAERGVQSATTALPHGDTRPAGSLAKGASRRVTPGGAHA